MGPTNLALLRYYQADQAFRTAQSKLDSVTRNARQQDIKVKQLAADKQSGHARAIELEAKSKELELEVKAREDRIELLRERQNNSQNQKEYQALIIEINTQKVDKAKLEEQTLVSMEAAEAQKKSLADVTTRLDLEEKRLAEMKSKIDDQVQTLTAELETFRGPLVAAEKDVRPQLLDLYRRAAEKYEGEGLAAIDRPDPREEEYLCTGCHTYLIADTYNRLRNRDEACMCKKCGRLLYISEDFTPDKAIKQKKLVVEKKPPGPKKARAPKKKPADGPPDADADAQTQVQAQQPPADATTA